MTTTFENKPASTTQAHRTGSKKGSNYLTFKLAGQEYGIKILKVREINGIVDITVVPEMPDYMKGVIKLRGKVIPVIDLRIKFGLPEAGYTEQTCIIVVDVGRDIGIIVDTLSDVLEIPADCIEPPPPMGGTVDTTFILGMGKVGDSVKVLLQIDQVMTADDLQAVAEAAQG